MRIWIWTVLLMAATPARAFDLCAMSDVDAKKSPLCLRYMMECTVQAPTEPAPPRYADLSPLQRLEALYMATAGIAAKQCEVFSYEEADAAVRMKLRRIPKED